ncbi:MAG TPA: S8 family serine peptidase [Bacteroidales bacterium]|nr:S8 family serine peptidase [Bacteroidales bacterium]
MKDSIKHKPTEIIIKLVNNSFTDVLLKTESFSVSGQTSKEDNLLPQSILPYLTDNTIIEPVFKQLYRTMKVRQLKESVLTSEMYADQTKAESVNLSRYLILRGLDLTKNTIEDICKQLTADPEIEFAEPNAIATAFLKPSDPWYNSQWPHKLTSIEQAWEIEQGNSDVVIGIIDTGIDFGHEDLAVNIWHSNTGEPGFDYVDVDTNSYKQNGYVLKGGEDYTIADNVPVDFYGHGTLCAGIAAAVGENGNGVCGVAFHSKIMPLRAGFAVNYFGLEYALFESDDVVNCIYYAVNNGVDIISMSFGIYDSLQLLHEAIQYAYSHHVVLVAGAGNNNNSIKMYPAAFEEVIAVASTNMYDIKSTFSNYGFWVDVAAPGGDAMITDNIISTVPKTGGAMANESGYNSASGTSMASPYVAGLAALVLSGDSTWTPQEIRTIITQGVDQPVSEVYIGTGRVNALKILTTNNLSQAVAEITSPLNGQLIDEYQIITGTVECDSFWIYYGHGIYPDEWHILDSGISTSGTLAEWDNHDFESGIYSILLRTKKSGYLTDQSVSVYISRKLHPGWPKQLDVPAIGHSYTPTLADIDGDGIKDVLIHSNAADYAFHGDGTSLTGWPTYVNYASYGTTAQVPGSNVADIDNDGAMEVVTVNRDHWIIHSPENTVYPFNVFNDQAEFENGWPMESEKYGLRNAFDMPATLADLDNNGTLEIIGRSSGNLDESQMFHVLKADGGDFMNWPYKLPADFNTYGNCYVSVRDLNRDGYKEIIGIARNKNTSRSSLYIWNFDGSLKEGYPILLTLNRFFYGPGLTVVDIDNDSEYEIGVVAEYGTCYTNYGKIIYFNLDGSVVTGWPAQFSNQMISPTFVTGDVDNNASLETFFGTLSSCSVSSEVHGFRNNGTVLPGWPQKVFGSVWSVPALADVNGDNFADILVITDKGYIYAWNNDGSMVNGFPILTGGPNEIKASNSGVAVGDIDGDNLVEIIASTMDATVYVWDLQAPVSDADGQCPMFLCDPLYTGSPFNSEPIVFAGDDRIIFLQDTATLKGLVSDDGLPYAKPLTISWNAVSNFDKVIIQNPDNDTTRVTFTSPGKYWFQLSANDTRKSSKDSVAVTVYGKTEEISATICEGEFFSIGDSVFTDAGEYLVHYSNHPEFDSVMHLTLVVNEKNNKYLARSICSGSVFAVGDSVFTKAGSYIIPFTNIQGCDSIVHLSLSISAIPIVELGNDTTITSVANLTLDAGSGFKSYAWNNGSTTRTLFLQNLPVGDHIYSVKVTDSKTCSNTDTIIVGVILSTQNQSLKVHNNLNLEIYPNPVSDELYIRSDTPLDTELNISLLDIYGKIVCSVSRFHLEYSDPIILKLNNLNSGIYILRINNSNKSQIAKIVKK